MRMSTEKKMAEERRKARVPAKVPLTEINEYLMCQLCIGYLIDATAIIECQHTFCKSCILKYLETNSYCPICEVQLNEAKPHLSLRSDDILQKLVYKLVPSLVSNEIRRRVEFVTSSKSAAAGGEDEVEDATTAATLPEIQMIKETQDAVFLSPDDHVSLSLEYFKSAEAEVPEEPAKGSSEETPKKNTCSDKANDRRYLKCPAAVSVGLLKKFIRMKYGLSDDYRVDLVYNGDRDNNLENDLTLLDLSFIFKWMKEEPMRFHYRIYDRPVKSLTARPAVKRPAPALLDDPPHDDDQAPGPSNRHSTTSQTKHPRLGSSSSTSATGSSTTTTTTTTTTSGKGSTKTAAAPGPPPTPPTLRTRNSTGGDEAEMSSSSSCKSPDRKITTSTSCSSSSESPGSPLKISIRADGKHHHHHHHRHRHHKEKHKRKSKSKDKDRDKERDKDKNKDKERYKYNAHPNPSQSQTISVKPGKHHHHHHRHRSSSSASTGAGGSNPTPGVADAPKPTSVGNGTAVVGVAPVVKPNSNANGNQNPAPVQKILERRTSGIQVKPIAIPAKKPTPKAPNLPESVHLQVPKSVTLIPVTPGGKVANARPEPNKRPSLSGTSHTFTHPITNKSLHQITVTEVPPPPKTASPSITPSSSSSSLNNMNNNANSITIEKCSPNTTSHNHLSIPASKQFSGPGSMEITKIYCDNKSSGGSSGVKSVFDTQQGKKLKGLDISISPSNQNHSQKAFGSGRKLEELSTPFPPKLNLNNLPKIPGVSILPQAIHNAKQQQQQRNFNHNQGLSMSLSCTKLGENSAPRENAKSNQRRNDSSASSNAYEALGMRVPSPPNKDKSVSNRNNDQRPKSATVKSTATPKRPFESAFHANASMSTSNATTTKARRDSTGGSLQPPAEKKRSASTEHHVDSPLDLSGRSSRSTPPGDTRPLTPIPPPNCSSPKLKGSGHKSPQSSSAAAHTQTILSIAQNLAQKQHQQNQQKQRGNSTAVRPSSSSPPSNSPPNPSPPIPNPFHPLGNLMTLSNAAALHKMNQQHAAQMSLQNSPLNNLVAAATAAGYGSASSPPISPGNGVGLPPGLLQHFNHHHHLNAMNQLMSQQQTGKGPLDSGIFGNIAAAAAVAGLNGRLPGYGQGTATISPPLGLQNPFFNPSQLHSRPPIRIPNVPAKLTHSPSAKSSAVTIGYNALKAPAKPAKVNGISASSSNAFVAPNSIIPISKATASSSSTSATAAITSNSVKNGGIPNSMKISNFLPPKSTSSTNPNTNATITSSISSLGKFLNMSSDNHSSSSQSKPVKHTVSSLVQPKSTEDKPSKPISPVPKAPKGEAKDSAKNGSDHSRLGALGAALGLVPVPHDPPILPIPAAPVSPMTLLAPQRQNQALRTIPNPSLLSSSRPSASTSAPIKPKPVVPVNKAQAIELNMKLWIDRYGGWKDGRNSSNPQLSNVMADVAVKPEPKPERQPAAPTPAKPEAKSLNTIVNGLSMKHEREAKNIQAAAEEKRKIEPEVQVAKPVPDSSRATEIIKPESSVPVDSEPVSANLEKSDEAEEEMDVDVESLDAAPVVAEAAGSEIDPILKHEAVESKPEESEPVSAPQQLKLESQEPSLSPALPPTELAAGEAEKDENLSGNQAMEIEKSEKIESDVEIQGNEVLVSEESEVQVEAKDNEHLVMESNEMDENNSKESNEISDNGVESVAPEADNHPEAAEDMEVQETVDSNGVPESEDAPKVEPVHEESYEVLESADSAEILANEPVSETEDLTEEPIAIDGSAQESVSALETPEEIVADSPETPVASVVRGIFPFIITEEDSLGENSPALIIAEPEDTNEEVLPEETDEDHMEADAIPDEAEAIPAEAEAIPYESAAIPNETEAVPTEAKAISEEAEAIPDKAEAIPEENNPISEEPESESIPNIIVTSPKPEEIPEIEASSDELSKGALEIDTTEASESPPLSSPSQRLPSEGPSSPALIGSPGSDAKKMENLEKVTAGLLASATNYNNNTLLTTNDQ